MEVKCPGCGKPTVFSSENPSRPFCSERCRLIDLGAWAEEKYKVPVKGDAMDDSTNTDDSDDDGPDNLH